MIKSFIENLSLKQYDYENYNTQTYNSKVM